MGYKCLWISLTLPWYGKGEDLTSNLNSNCSAIEADCGGAGAGTLLPSGDGRDRGVPRVLRRRARAPSHLVHRRLLHAAPRALGQAKGSST